MVRGLVRVRQARVAQGLCPGRGLHSPPSLHNTLLGPSAPGGSRRGGECGRPAQLVLPAASDQEALAARPAPAWLPLGAAAERSCECAASARGPGVRWLGPARPKDLHLLHCLLLTPRPASPDRGLLCCLGKKKKKQKKNTYQKTKKGEKKKPPRKNENSMVLFHASLIRNSPCYHFPLKASVCLLYWLILGKLWLGLAT